MKPFEIALFKHFIEGKGMTTVFINNYRKRHHKANPASIEEYLSLADVKDVCVHAFYFVINERWGVDYWTNTQQEWLAFLEQNKSDYYAEKWWKLQGLAKILRNNWDAAKHWKQESRMTAAIRLGIDLSLLGLEDKEHTAPPTKMSEEYLREKALEEFNEKAKTDDNKVDDGETEKKPLLEFFAEDADVTDVLGDFVDVSLTKRKNDRRRLKDDEISVNQRNNQGRVTFNQTLSQEIKKRGGYEYASLLRNKKGDVIIKLNDEKGVVVCDGSRQRANANVCITSLVLVESLVEFLGIERDYEIVNVKEVARTSDYVAYLVTRK